MRGEILDFDAVTSTGRISGDDGSRYGFVSASLQSGATVRPGQRVDFVPDGDSATQILYALHEVNDSRLHLVGQGLDHVGPSERVHGGRDVGLEGEHLLRSKRQTRSFLAG